MKNFLIAFLVFLVWSFFGIWLYSWLQPESSNSEHKDSIATTTVKDVGLDLDEPIKIDEQVIATNPVVKDSLGLVENVDDAVTNFSLPSGLRATNAIKDVIFSYSEGITIWKNTNQIEYPNAIQDFKYRLNTYLLEHPEEELHIASVYSPAENIEHPNLGYQRADKIKRILERTGIPSEKMVIKPLIREIEFDVEDRFTSGIYFTFQPLDLKRIESLKLAIPNSRIIYPKLVNNTIFVNEDLQQLLEEVKTSMNNDPGLKVEVIGHTDNVGNATDNYQLALKYARQVRWYLVTKGKLDPKRVVAISEGEARSIASNRTERGRLLNRRIEIVYKTS
ncbi:MAG: OmpA family protein [Bacteroidia bacterium]|nr:OmpA family protein [Bacteroidia bacterium]NNM24146.1 OmpA family protein [Flavobacteriaceae bacterium]